MLTKIDQGPKNRYSQNTKHNQAEQNHIAVLSIKYHIAVSPIFGEQMG